MTKFLFCKLCGKKFEKKGSKIYCSKYCSCRNRYLNNIDKVREYQKKYYKKYYQENKERIQAYYKEYMKKYIEEIGYEQFRLDERCRDAKRRLKKANERFFNRTQKTA